MRVYPRHRLDLSPWHIGYAIGACFVARRPEGPAHRIESGAGRTDAIACFSVRSGFELLLNALALPEGSELLVSAITHPDMVRIAERHGLRVVPVDVDEGSLAPRPDLLEAAVSQRTRAVLVAHLFGSRIDLDPVVDLARRHGLLLIEDCAQSLRGPTDSGDARADVAMFSFGSIKTCPALGGAVLYVRDPQTLARMRELHDAWPRQSRVAYLTRAFRFGGLLCLQAPTVFGLFARLGRLVGVDLEQLVNASVRALRPPSAGDDARFAAWLRRRPSVPLLALLAKRLESFDYGRLERRAEAGERVAAALPAGLPQPGRRAPSRTHWVFPVVTRTPERLLADLVAAGFDATRSTTSIAAVDAPPGTAQPETAQAVMAKVVFLPVYPELPDTARARLIETLEAYCRDRDGRGDRG